MVSGGGGAIITNASQISAGVIKTKLDGESDANKLATGDLQAAAGIVGAQLAAGAVGATQIANNAVGGAQLAATVRQEQGAFVLADTVNGKGYFGSTFVPDAGYVIIANAGVLTSAVGGSGTVSNDNTVPNIKATVTGVNSDFADWVNAVTYNYKTIQGTLIATVADASSDFTLFGFSDTAGVNPFTGNAVFVGDYQNGQVGIVSTAGTSTYLTVATDLTHSHVYKGVWAAASFQLLVDGVSKGTITTNVPAGSYAFKFITANEATGTVAAKTATLTSVSIS